MEGMRGNGFAGDIALDDVSFSSSTCGSKMIRMTVSLMKNMHMFLKL